MPDPNSRSARVATDLFGSLFIVVGLGIFVWITVIPSMRLLEARRSWVETPCTIVSSEVGVHRGSDTTTFSIDIVYNYVWEEEHYTGGRHDFLSGSSSGSAAKEIVVSAYPAGARAVCYVDPNNPENAVLSLDFAPNYLIGLIGLVFSAAGAGVIVAMRRERAKAIASAQAWLPDAGAGPETTELRMTTSRVARLGAIAGMAVIWNGIVGTMLFFAFFVEDAPLPAKIFLSLFGVIGAFLLAGAVYLALALFNPRVRLRITPGAPALMDQATLEWTVQGPVRRISRMRLWLVGEERVEYRDGKNSRHATNTFHTQLLVDLDEGRAIRTGRIAFDMPGFSMHSLDASKIAVVWRIHLHGDIRRWPDIVDDYPVTVPPVRLDAHG